MMIGEINESSLLHVPDALVPLEPWAGFAEGLALGDAEQMSLTP